MPVDPNKIRETVEKITTLLDDMEVEPRYRHLVKEISQGIELTLMELELSLRINGVDEFLIFKLINAGLAFSTLVRTDATKYARESVKSVKAGGT
jgi:hypothetical protein